MLALSFSIPTDKIAGLLNSTLAAGGPDQSYALMATAEQPNIIGFVDFRPYHIGADFLGQVPTDSFVIFFEEPDSRMFCELANDRLSTQPASSTTKIPLIC